MTNSQDLDEKRRPVIPGNNAEVTRDVSPPHRLLLGLALLLTFAAYSGTLRYQFVHDDRGQIVENPAVHSWRYAPRYFTEHVWASVYPEEWVNYYRPVFLVWLRANDMLFDGHPWGWHLTNVLAHLVVTLLVYFLARRVTEDCLAAAIAALLFGLHPVHIEAVAWVSGVTEPLLGIFFLAAFLCYLKKRDAAASPGRWMTLSLVFFVLAMLEKETGVILPVVIVVYEWMYGAIPEVAWRWRRMGRRAGHALLCALPYFTLILPYLAARTYALKGFSHIVTPLSFATLVYTWPSLAWFWVKHLLWPVRLSTFYDLPAVTRPTLFNLVLPALGVLLALAALLYGSSRSRTFAFASAWIVIPLFPLLDLRVFLQDDFAHDRYLYLPSVGLAMMAALGLRRVHSGRAKLLGQPAARSVAALALAAPLAFGTAYQSFYLANDLVFYQYNLRVAPNNKYARSNLATVMGERGMYAEAVRLFQQVLEKDPGFWPATYNLGYTYYKVGQLEEAERYLIRAIQINPAKPEEYLYLGLTRLRMGRDQEAEAAIRRAIQIRPDGYGYHFALGVVLKTRGDLSGALEQFRAELASHPQQWAARQQVAEIQARMEQRPEGSGAP